MESRHCEEKEDGSLQLNLYENVEIGVGHVCYVDDLTISGTTPNVASNTRLFLNEWTPYRLDMAQPDCQELFPTRPQSVPTDGPNDHPQQWCPFPAVQRGTD